MTQISLVLLLFVLCVPGDAVAEQPIRYRIPDGQRVPGEGRAFASLERLPTVVAQLPNSGQVESVAGAPGNDPLAGMNLAELMRPTFSLAAEGLAESSDVTIASYNARVSVPTYPIFGPPPPFVNGSFSYTDLDAPDTLDLPSDLYDYSLGFSWIRPINDRWTVRMMFSTALATDGNNQSSDAWQFRGGMFAMWRANDEWTWILGAIALGRNDLPVVPAIGAIWQPYPTIRFDLTFPKPKVAFLLVDNGPRQQWGYVGGGLSGGTWAIERTGQIDDQLTYRDWRLVLGWESTPTPAPGQPFTRGRKLGAEVGFVFARSFEFESGLADIDLDETFVIRATASF